MGFFHFLDLPKSSRFELPFYDQHLDQSSAMSDLSIHDDNKHFSVLKENNNHLKIIHINKQSRMPSTFDSLLLTNFNHYSFDIITMSETWLKQNDLLLQHVTIPGYVHAFNHRDKKKGGGVGVYLKENIQFRRQSDIEKRYPKMEHLWLEIMGCNKHSKLLLGSVYRSDSVMVYSDWLESFEFLPSDVSATWDGMLMITGDMNVDLLRSNKSSTQNYVNILQNSQLDSVSHQTNANNCEL